MDLDSTGARVRPFLTGTGVTLFTRTTRRTPQDAEELPPKKAKSFVLELRKSLEPLEGGGRAFSETPGELRCFLCEVDVFQHM